MKEKIKRLIETETKITSISTKSRKQNIVEARVIYSILCLKHTKDSYERIGKVINRDHSTIVHHRKIYNIWTAYPKMYLNNLSLLEKVDNVIDALKNPEEKESDALTRYITKNILLSKQLATLKITVQEQKKTIDKLEQYQPIR
mgnify:CR=1 FL=1|tara:strand:- start:4990 stop:5421 length:432 start_codon:yes stop_codon:yes gene_type:complete